VIIVRILIVGKIHEVQMLLSFISPVSKSLNTVDALIIGSAEDRELHGLMVDNIYVAENADPGYTDDIVESIATALGPSQYDYIFLTASRLYKEAGSRVAQRLGAPAITEATSISIEGNRLILTRSMLAGKAISREMLSAPAVVLVMPGRYGQASLDRMVKSISRIKISGKRSIEILERKPKQRGGVRLEDAEIIVSVGRGFKSKEDLSLAFKLAELIGAQVGCSRPIAADLKWLSEEHWVGLSGKKVKPKLYMAIGISGQPQHLAGIMDAKIIVAINKDPNAPIFKYADYGVVEDLYHFIPKLIEKISSNRLSLDGH
jgi:electron transfer flavoprotein alpha subunit